MPTTSLSTHATGTPRATRTIPGSYLSDDDSEPEIIPSSVIDSDEEPASRLPAYNIPQTQLVSPAATRVTRPVKEVIYISSDDEDNAKHRRRTSDIACGLDDDGKYDNTTSQERIIPSSCPEEDALYPPLYKLKDLEVEPRHMPRAGTSRTVHTPGGPSSGKPSGTQPAWDDPDAVLELTATKHKTVARIPKLALLAGDEDQDRSTTPTTATATPTASPSKRKTGVHKTAAASGQTRREAFAQKLFDDLNDTVFTSKLDGTVISWNAHFRTTAGRANWKSFPDGGHDSSIELSPKVLDCDERIQNTLSHEMCHLATWIIDGKAAERHGNLWWSWAGKVMKARPDIQISDKHSYEIAYKFSWRCQSCHIVYGRHSNSIDPRIEVCSCKGELIPQFNGGGTPRKRNKAGSKFAAEKLQGSPVARTPSKLSHSDRAIPPSPSRLRGVDLASGSSPSRGIDISRSGSPLRVRGVDIDEGLDDLLRSLENTKI